MQIAPGNQLFQLLNLCDAFKITNFLVSCFSRFCLKLITKRWFEPLVFVDIS